MFPGEHQKNVVPPTALGRTVITKNKTRGIEGISIQMIKNKRKELASEQAMNVYVGKAQFHSFLTLAIDEGEWSGLSPRPLHPRGKIPQYSFNRRLGRPQNRSEHFGEEKNPLHLSCVKPRFFAKYLNCDHSSHQNSFVRKTWKRRPILHSNSETPWTSRVFCRSTVWQPLVNVWFKSVFLKRQAAAR